MCYNSHDHIKSANYSSTDIILESRSLEEKNTIKPLTTVALLFEIDALVVNALALEIRRRKW